jgi:hypothetical protein
VHLTPRLADVARPAGDVVVARYVGAGWHGDVARADRRLLRRGHRHALRARADARRRRARQHPGRREHSADRRLTQRRRRAALASRVALLLARVGVRVALQRHVAGHVVAAGAAESGDVVGAVEWHAQRHERRLIARLACAWQADARRALGAARARWHRVSTKHTRHARAHTPVVVARLIAAHARRRRSWRHPTRRRRAVYARTQRERAHHSRVPTALTVVGHAAGALIERVARARRVAQRARWRAQTRLQQYSAPHVAPQCNHTQTHLIADVAEFGDGVPVADRVVDRTRARSHARLKHAQTVTPRTRTHCALVTHRTAALRQCAERLRGRRRALCVAPGRHVTVPLRVCETMPPSRLQHDHTNHTLLVDLTRESVETRRE